MTKRKLGIMETAQTFTNEICPFNAVVILRITDGPTEETLRQALTVLQRRHPLLRVHVVKEKKRYFFEQEGTPEIPLKVVNRKNDEHWQQAAEEELNRILDFFKDPLVYLTYLTGTGKEKKSEIILTFHHAIVDAVSSTNLAHEMLSLCASSPGQDFEPMELIPPAEHFFPPAFKGIRRKWNNLLFMLRQVGDEFRCRLRSKGLRKPPIHDSGRGKILTMNLSEATSAALSKRARRKRVTLNSLFEAAILMAVHKHLYEGKAGPFRSFAMADLRPYLTPPLEKEYLGSYFVMMRFTVDITEREAPAPQDFTERYSSQKKSSQENKISAHSNIESPRIWELASEINDIIYKALKKGDKFCSHLLSEQMMRAIFRFHAFRMATTAISYTGPVKLAEKYGKTAVKGIHAYVSNFVLGPEYTATVRLFDKKFHWDILYMDADMGIETAQVLADEIKNILKAAIKEED